MGSIEGAQEMAARLKLAQETLVIDIETERLRGGIEVGAVNEQREFFFVGRHELDHRRASIPRTTARNSAPDPGYPEGARAEKRSASRKPSVVT